MGAPPPPPPPPPPPMPSTGTLPSTKLSSEVRIFQTAFLWTNFAIDVGSRWGHSAEPTCKIKEGSNYLVVEHLSATCHQLLSRTPWWPKIKNRLRTHRAVLTFWQRSAVLGCSAGSPRTRRMKGSTIFISNSNILLSNSGNFHCFDSWWWMILYITAYRFRILVSPEFEFY